MKLPFCQHFWFVLNDLGMMVPGWCFYLWFLFIHATSGFIGIYDVPHFIKTLKYDVRIAMSVPDIITNGKTKKLKAYQVKEKLTSFCYTSE